MKAFISRTTTAFSKTLRIVICYLIISLKIQTPSIRFICVWHETGFPSV
jgi:hypothetical protein